MFFRKPAVRTWIVLLLIAGAGLGMRLAQREHFRKRPVYWALTAFHLAHARALVEGHPFHYVEADFQAADRFINKQAGAYDRPLVEFEAMADSLRAAADSLVYVPRTSDQGGWSVYYLVARALGADTLAQVVFPQIFVDLIATLVLFPIVVFITGRRLLAYLACLLYALYPPQALMVVSPFRDAWPVFAVIFGTGLLLPVWKGGPQNALRNLGWVVAAGLLIGCLTYGRTTAALTPLTLCALTWICWRRFLPSVAVGSVLIAVTLLTFLPWMRFTSATSDTLSIVTSGGGHSSLTGLAEQDNPLGLRFDDYNVLSYVIDVCGYDVEYGSFGYDAAARVEAKRFVADHRGWYAGMLAQRVYRYVVRDDKQRILWGFPKGPVRRAGERYLPLLGLLGILLGLFVFPRAWMALAWVLHFMVFVLPIQSHPRLLLGADWALLTGVVMLGGGAWILVGRLRGRPRRREEAVAKPRARSRKARKDPPPVAAPAPETGALRLPRALWIAGGTALVFDVVLAVLLQVNGPKAPAPRREWRRVFREGTVAEQVALVNEVGALGRASLPVVRVAGRSPHPDVQAAAVQAIASYKVPLVTVDFADPGVLSVFFGPPPGATAVVRDDPEAQDHRSVRITAPPSDFVVLLGTSWRQTHRGIFEFRLRARFNRPLLIGVANQAGNDLRWWEPLGSQVPRYQEFTTYYDNTFGDEFVNLVLIQGQRAPGDTAALVVDVDLLEVVQER